MNDVKNKSKRLAWLLRHGAIESGLSMDGAGFAAVDDVLRLVRMTPAALDEVVRDNDKGRYELRGPTLAPGAVSAALPGARIRACQGHSSGTPVTLEGLEATWETVAGDELLFHGTHAAVAAAICVEGLRAMERSHVHLAESERARVGKRAGVDVLLAVSPAAVRAAGFTIFRAPNGVILARAVPAEAIVDVIACNRPGERAAGALRALLRGAR